MLQFGTFKSMESLMENNYWLVINVLRDAVDGRANKNQVSDARLALAMALDRAVVGGLPSDEIKRLIGVLDELSDKIEEL